jgi:hypothetical protein
MAEPSLVVERDMAEPSLVVERDMAEAPLVVERDSTEFQVILEAAEHRWAPCVASLLLELMDREDLAPSL